MYDSLIYTIWDGFELVFAKKPYYALEGHARKGLVQNEVKTKEGKYRTG